MAARAFERLGLVVCQGPWQGRSGRDQLDLAIAAVGMDVAVELFFVGDGVLQLLVGERPNAARLPPSTAGWGSLPELGAVRFHVDASRHRELLASGCAFRAQVEPASPADMRARQAGCDRLLVA